MSRPRRAALSVALGILTSRVFGFLRDRAVLQALGASAFGDVFSTVFKLPNLLQNLLGEQTLSAGFIPVYTKYLAEGREGDARRLAGATLGWLMVLAGGAALLGVLLAEPIVAIGAAGFLRDASEVAAGARHVDRYPLAVRCVRIIFPMTALLVVSAWSMAVLNSHRRFFLSYAAPALWNVTIISAVAWAVRRVPIGSGTEALEGVVIAVCWGALIGGGVQLLAQLPMALRVARGLRLSLSRRVGGIGQVARAVGPVIAARGVVNLSGYLDILLGSLAHVGTQAALLMAQRLYLLPISLFGMAVSASELPELSREAAQQEEWIGRLRNALGQVSLVAMPSAVAFLALGIPIVQLLYGGGEIDLATTRLVALVLFAYSLGLLPSIGSRLLQNGFYALGDTKTPARIAVARVLLSALLGAGSMWILDSWSLARLFDVSGAGDHYLGAAGLALGAACGSWLEWILLIRRLKVRLPQLKLPWRAMRSFLAVSLVALAVAAGIWRSLSWSNKPMPLITVCVVYAAAYLAIVAVQDRPELRLWLGRRH